MSSILAKFFVESDVIEAVESGKIKVDPCELRDWAHEKGFTSVQLYAHKKIYERNEVLIQLGL